MVYRRMTKEKMQLIQDFLRVHPDTLAVYGYGSGVIPQYGSNPKDKKEMDFIFVVDHIVDWFQEDLKQNPQEFTFYTKRFFERAEQSDLEKGAPICYLSHIPFQDELVKVGVISKEQFLSSFYHRTSSFVPYRLEKPVQEIICVDDEIREAVVYDHRTMLMLALLMLDPYQATIYDLMHQICSVSYLGDFRQLLKCEDPNKVSNLLNGQLEYFLEDYKMVNFSYYKKGMSDVIQVNYDAIQHDLSLLPPVFQEMLDPYDDLVNALPVIRRDLIAYFSSSSNLKETFSQAMKGIQTVGPVKATQYGFRKFKKGITNRKRT